MSDAAGFRGGDTQVQQKTWSEGDFSMVASLVD